MLRAQNAVQGGEPMTTHGRSSSKRLQHRRLSPGFRKSHFSPVSSSTMRSKLVTYFSLKGNLSDTWNTLKKFLQINKYHFNFRRRQGSNAHVHACCSRADVYSALAPQRYTTRSLRVFAVPID